MSQVLVYGDGTFEVETMKRGISAGPPYMVATPAPIPAPSTRMTEEELDHIENNLHQGYRWGVDMRRLIDEVRAYMEMNNGR